MKLSKILLLAIMSLAVFSCETYNDKDIDYSAVAPLDGRWICLLYDYDDYMANSATAEPLEYVNIWASGTSNNDRDKIWWHMIFGLSPFWGEEILNDPDFWEDNDPDQWWLAYVDVLSIKLNCDPKALTFSLTNGVSVAPPSRVYNHFAWFDSEGQSYSTSNMAGWDVSVSDGKVTLDGWETATSGYYADKIEFVLDLNDSPYTLAYFGEPYEYDPLPGDPAKTDYRIGDYILDDLGDPELDDNGVPIVIPPTIDEGLRGVRKFYVVGNRITGWEEDYAYINTFYNNYTYYDYRPDRPATLPVLP